VGVIGSAIAGIFAELLMVSQMRLPEVELTLQELRTAQQVQAQADGKGVPMGQPPIQRPAERLAKGQKPTKKKEAVVTVFSTISPYQRTPQ
jgi:hypothetical protein